MTSLGWPELRESAEGLGWPDGPDGPGEPAEPSSRLPAPVRRRVLAVAHQKGGVGKTTSAVNLAAALALGGLRVLVVDLDPQGNASTALGIDAGSRHPSAYDVLVDGVPLAEAVQPCDAVAGLDVLPATTDLVGAEIELVAVADRETRLRAALHDLVGPPGTVVEGASPYHYVVIDCPPALGLLTLNALVAAEELLVPVLADAYAMDGLAHLAHTVSMVRAHLNPALHVSTCLLTMYDARTRVAAGVAEELRQHFGDQVLTTTIPRSARVAEAPAHGRTVLTHDPTSPGAAHHVAAAREIAQRGAAR